jgi:hypothetical protein
MHTFIYNFFLIQFALGLLEKTLIDLAQFCKCLLVGFIGKSKLLCYVVIICENMFPHIQFMHNVIHGPYNRGQMMVKGVNITITLMLI